jgi:hypothetical protein
VKVLRIARDSEHPLRQQNRLDDDPTLRRWLNQPANTVLLANGLALSAQQAWDSPHSQRWQYLTSLYLQIRWKKCSSSCTSKPPTVRAIMPCPTCGTRRSVDLAVGHESHPCRDAAGTSAHRRGPGAMAQAMRRAAGRAEPLHQCHAPDHRCPDALVASGMRRVMILMADRTHANLRVHQTAGCRKKPPR